MEGMPPDNGYLPPPSSVQIKTAKTQKHLYCPVFTAKITAIIRLRLSSCLAIDENPRFYRGKRNALVKMNAPRKRVVQK